MEYKYSIEIDKFKSHQHSNGISTRGGRTVMYKKKANSTYEFMITEQLRSQFVANGYHDALDSPVSLGIDFYVKTPTQINGRRLSAKERQQLRGQWATKKPDLTNIIKTIEDCIEKAGIITDDALIVKYDQITKRYHESPKYPYEAAIITIKKLD